MTSLTINPELPKRGEIWLVNFEPTVVISSDSVGKLPIKLIAPITDWKTYFSANFWHLKIEPNSINGLNKASAIDTLQLRGVD
nr:MULTISPECIES: type II toxin-antitoxin system PemK/MazF family toxin [unclassified Microcystis]